MNFFFFSLLKNSLYIAWASFRNVMELVISGIMGVFTLGIFSSPELLGTQGELIGWP